MLAIHQHGAPLNQMTVADCLRVLENDCDPESAKLVAYVLRSHRVDDEKKRDLKDRIDRLRSQKEAIEMQHVRACAERDKLKGENEALTHKFNAIKEVVLV